MAPAVTSFPNEALVNRSHTFQGTNHDDLKIQLEWSKLPFTGPRGFPGKILHSQGCGIILLCSRGVQLHLCSSPSKHFLLPPAQR